jgi:hypothetical protein
MPVKLFYCEKVPKSLAGPFAHHPKSYARNMDPQKIKKIQTISKAYNMQMQMLVSGSKTVLARHSTHPCTQHHKKKTKEAIFCLITD